ncbi:putative PHD type zinc finger protein with BAH domain-containing protein, partial [Rhizophlyctis rosea]
RVGAEFQTELPELEVKREPSPDRSAEDSRMAEASALGSRGKKRKRGQKLALPERTEKTPEVLDRGVYEYTTAALSHMPQNMKAIALDRALEELHKAKYDTAAALAEMAKVRKMSDLGVVEWTDEEMKAFDRGAIKYGHDLPYVQKEVPTKNMREMVSYFYKWKKSRRYVPVYGQFCEKYRPNKVLKGAKTLSKPQNKNKQAASSRPSPEPTPDDSQSEMEDMPTPHSTTSLASSPSTARKECSHCWTSDSPSWRTRMDGLKRELMCKTCGEYWLKYGAARVVGDSVRKANRERGVGSASRSHKRKHPNEADAKKIKRGRPPLGSKTNTRTTNTPEPLRFEEPPDYDESYACAICREDYQYGGNELVWCEGCYLRVHRGCYGVEENGKKTFRCERCQNIEKPESSL